jgi:hypothetical protein
MLNSRWAPFPSSRRSFGIIELGRFSSQSIQDKRVTGKVLSAWDLAAEYPHFPSPFLAKYSGIRGYIQSTGE